MLPNHRPLLLFACVSVLGIIAGCDSTEPSNPATRLAFAVEPSTVTAGATISPAVQVSVLNSSGAQVGGSSATITLAITAGTGATGAALGGTVTRAAVNGIATFNDLTLSKVATGYTLTATSGSLSLATSTAFAVTAGAASSMTFSGQPSTTEAGIPISPAVEVQVVDALGNPTSASVTLSITAGTGAAGAVLGGTLTKATVNGIATFDDLTVDKASAGYTLTASATGGSSTTSTEFEVAAGAPASLAFTTQPGNVAAGAPISPSVSVTVSDAFGNTVTSAAGAVTLTITDGTGTAGSVLGGVVALNPTNGVATFDALTVDQGGADYTFSAAFGTLPDAVSEPFRVSGWGLLLAHGAGPIGLNAYTLAPALGVVFAANMEDYTGGSLWKLDLTTDTWSQLPAASWPIGKFRRLIYDPTTHQILTFWDGLGQVYSIPETGGAWAPQGSTGNSDLYYEGYAFFDPLSSRLAVFAGYGFGTWKNLLWEWSLASNSWLDVTPGGTSPEPRFGSGTSGVAVDATGNRVFLGQRSHGGAPGNYDDLWRLDLTTNTWTNLIAPSTGPDARIGSGLAYSGQSATLYRFGGCGLTIAGPGCPDFHSDFLMAKPDITPVTWVEMPQFGPTPPARMVPGLFVDVPRNRVVLVSGLSATRWEDDVWAYYLP